MLGEEFTGKSCYVNFFKLKNKIMLGESHVSQIHVRRVGALEMVQGKQQK